MGEAEDIALRDENERLRRRLLDLEKATLVLESIDVLCALDSMFEGIQIISHEGVYLYVNKTAAHQGQQEPEDLLGRKMAEAYPGIEATEMFGVLMECMARRKPRSMLNKFEFPDGGSGWFDLRFTPVPGGVLILSVDISDIKRAEQELRDTTDNLTTTLSCMAEAVISTDPEGRIAGMNLSAEELTGWTLAEAKGRLLDDTTQFLRQVDETPIENTVRKVLRSGLKIGLANHTILVARDGSRIPIASSGAPMIDDSGRIRGTVIVLKDMRDEYRLTRQLYQAQKMEAVGRLAGGVAHDFNNILTAIFSFGGFAAESLSKQNPVYDDIQEILKAAERARSLTRQLLAFSRRQAIEPRVVNPNTLLDDIDRMLRRLLGEDIEVLTKLSPDVGNVRMDPGVFEQVLVNLAVNARDAMPNGGKLTIETIDLTLTEAYGVEKGASVPEGDYVVVAVSDDGDGMDKVTQERIFEPFFTTKEAGKGTGLGLSTCYGIIKQAGGFIWVYSEPGDGTTFKIYLPQVLEEAQALKRKAPAGSIEGTETILIVEDDDQVRALAVRVLRKLGYDVLVAETGGDGLLACDSYENKIDLLLTDVVMPEMGGRALAERLAKDRPKMKVLYMSGYTSTSITHRGMLAADFALLQKPFTPEQLGTKVREVLDS